jgi:hypothetical protein
MESELDQINHQIKDLEHQSETATGDAKRQLEEALEALKEKREQIDLKLQPDLYSDAERNLALKAEEAKTELRGDL